MNPLIHSPWRLLRAAVVACGVTALVGCASAPGSARPAKDPFEPFNRQVFAFNDAVDGYVLRPVAVGYTKVTPQFFRDGVSNVVGNVRDVWSAVNLVLQGRPGDASLEVFRVAINSTLGLGGLLDIAGAAQIDSHKEDFGQTLGVWGVRAGPYLVLPLLGPSTVRDVVGLPGDLYFTPGNLFTDDATVRLAVRALSLVNTRAQLLDATNFLDDVALDRYSFVRDAYLQRRQYLIFNGDPPDTFNEDERSQLRPLADEPSASLAPPTEPKPLTVSAAPMASLPSGGLP